jgi:4-carboxymuconolactone decarboxylase
MTDLSDPRTRGNAEFTAVTTLPATPVTTPFIASVVDYVFARIWTRPGLSRRDRRLVSITCVAWTGVAGALTPHVYSALNSRDLTADDMRELVLQFAVSCGWPKSSYFESVVRQQLARIAEADGSSAPADASVPVIADDPGAVSRGGETYAEIMGQPPHSGTPYTDDYLLGFVFGEVWKRPHLTIRERRMVSLVGAALGRDVETLEREVAAAIEAGDLTIDELREIALHAGAYGGAATGALLDRVVGAA